MDSETSKECAELLTGLLKAANTKEADSGILDALKTPALTGLAGAGLGAAAGGIGSWMQDVPDESEEAKSNRILRSALYSGALGGGLGAIGGAIPGLIGSASQTQETVRNPVPTNAPDAFGSLASGTLNALNQAGKTPESITDWASRLLGIGGGAAAQELYHRSSPAAGKKIRDTTAHLGAISNPELKENTMYEIGNKLNIDPIKSVQPISEVDPTFDPLNKPRRPSSNPKNPANNPAIDKEWAEFKDAMKAHNAAAAKNEKAEFKYNQELEKLKVEEANNPLAARNANKITDKLHSLRTEALGKSNISSEYDFGGLVDKLTGANKPKSFLGKHVGKYAPGIKGKLGIKNTPTYGKPDFIGAVLDRVMGKHSPELKGYFSGQKELGQIRTAENMAANAALRDKPISRLVRKGGRYALLPAIGYALGSAAGSSGEPMQPVEGD